MSIHVPEKYNSPAADTARYYQEAALLLLNKVICLDDAYGAMIHGSTCNSDPNTPVPRDIDILVRTRHSGRGRTLRNAAQDIANDAGIIIDLAVVSGETPTCNPFFVSALRQSSQLHKAWTRGSPLYGMRAVNDYPAMQQLSVARDCIVDAYTTTRANLLGASQSSHDRLDLPMLERSLRLPRSMARNGLELIRLSEGEDYTTVTSMPSDQLMGEFTDSFPLSGEAIDELHQLQCLDEQRRLLGLDGEFELWARENESEVIGGAYSVIESTLPVFRAIA